jgi:hydrogenase-4 component E
MSIFSLLAFFAATSFTCVIFMNLVRKNTTLVDIYITQSAATAAALYTLALSQHEMGLFYASVLTLIVKAIVAPVFLLHLIRKYNAHFSAASTLSGPLSLMAISATTFFAYSFVAPRLPGFSDTSSVPLLFAAIFATLFLMVNRRGALSAVVGILSLENGVVLLSTYLGIEHSLALEFAISFDVTAWIAIAIGFLTLMYRQFGVVDSATLNMTHLTEE